MGSITSTGTESGYRSQFSLELTEIRANTATSISSYSFWWLYKFNWTTTRAQDPYTHEKSGTFRPTESTQVYDYFVFTDWDAWINTYGNISLKEITKHPIEGQSYDNYIAWVNSDYFVLQIMNDNLYRFSHETLKYNLTDGTLVSSLRTDHYYEFGLNNKIAHQIISVKTDLINKEKVSEEIKCLEIESTEKSKSDDSPILGFFYSILLVPLLRRFKIRL